MDATRSQSDELLGNPRPRAETVLPRVTSSGPDACDWYRLAGGNPFDWQEHAVDVLLGEKQNGKWASRENLLLCARQNGKGTVQEILELWCLFMVPGVKLILHSAHELKTAKEHYQRMKLLCEHLVDVGEIQPPKYRENNEEISIEVWNTDPVTDKRYRTKLRFLARSNGTARGFTADVLFLDEAFALTDSMMGALLPTLSAKSKTGNPLVIYASSAGLRTSFALASIRERGIAGRIQMLDWSADPDADLDDRQAWADANPSLGLLITEEAIEGERDAMTDEQFARERLGIWYNPKTVEVIPADVWAALSSDSEIVGDVVFAVAAEGDRSTTAIAVCGEDVDGVPKVEIIDSRPQVAWAADFVAALVRRNPECLGVVIDSGSQAKTLLPPLEADERVPVWRIAMTDVKAACAGFLDAVTEKRVTHSPDPVLAAAAAGATQRRLGSIEGAWAWGSKDASKVCSLVAATYAFHGFQTRSQREAKKKPVHTGKVWF